jgi:hypothetical protein
MFQPDNPSASGWYLTHHLRKRAIERGITDAEVFEVLQDPEVTYDQAGYGPSRQVRQRGLLGVVVNASTGAVITVVFRDHERWLRHQSVAAVAV